MQKGENAEGHIRLYAYGSAALDNIRAAVITWLSGVMESYPRQFQIYLGSAFCRSFLIRNVFMYSDDVKKYNKVRRIKNEKVQFF